MTRHGPWHRGTVAPFPRFQRNPLSPLIPYFHNIILQRHVFRRAGQNLQRLAFEACYQITVPDLVSVAEITADFEEHRPRISRGKHVTNRNETAARVPYSSRDDRDSACRCRASALIVLSLWWDSIHVWNSINDCIAESTTTTQPQTSFRAKTLKYS